MNNNRARDSGSHRDQHFSEEDRYGRIDDNKSRSSLNKTNSPFKKRGENEDYGRENSTIGVNTDMEIHRLHEKCKSYQNEVSRLNTQNEEETKKLRVRIKTLESGIKRLDLQNNYCYNFIKDIHSLSLKSMENLNTGLKMEWVKPIFPKQIEDQKNWLNEPNIKEFIKQRRIFTHTEGLIDNLRDYSFDDLQNGFDHSHQVLNELKNSSSQNQTKVSQDDMNFKDLMKGNLDSFVREVVLQFVKNNGYEGQLEVTNETQLNCTVNKIELHHENIGHSLEILLINLMAELGKSVDIEANTINKLKGSKSDLESTSIVQKKLKDDKSELELQVEQLQKSNSEWNLEMDKLNEKVNNLLGKKETLNEQENSQVKLQADLLKKKKQIENEYNEMERKRQQMDDLLYKDKDEQDELVKSTEEKKKEITRLEDSWPQTRKDIDYWNKYVFQVQDQYEELTKRNSDNEKKLSGLKATHESHEGKVIELLAKVSQEELEVQRLDSLLKSKKDFQGQQEQKAGELEARSSKIEKEINNVKDLISKVTSVLTDLNDECAVLDVKKNLEAGNMNNYLEKMVKVAGNLVKDCESICGSEDSLKKSTELKKHFETDLGKVESLLRSKLLMESMAKEKKEDLLTFQGKERTNILLLNQLGKDLDNINLNLIEARDTVDEQEDKIKSRKQEKERVANELSDLRVRMEGLSGENMILNVGIDSLKNMSESLRHQCDKVDYIERMIKDFKDRLNKQLQDSRNAESCLEEAMRIMTLQMEELATLSIKKDEEAKKQNRNQNGHIEAIGEANKYIEEKQAALNKKDTELEIQRKRVEDKRLELARLEIRIDMMSDKEKQSGMYIDDEGHAYKLLEMAIGRNTRDLQDFGLRKQEDLLWQYTNALKETSYAQKHALLGLLSSIHEVAWNDLLEYKKANANLNGNLHLSDGNSKKDGVIQWNNLFCDYFKGEILCSFDSDYHKELIDILSSKFDDIKQNSNINFVRWLTKSTLLRPAKEGDAENSGDADFFVNLNKKKWSKQLKHISNQVAHIMKGSSYFLNYTSHIINIFAKEAEKLGMMKKRGMQFSSELFLRHKKLIENVHNFEKDQPSLDNLCLFAKNVALYGKNEIKYQEVFLNDFLYIMMGEEIEDTQRSETA